MVVEARQSFQFFRQNTWVLKNNKALSKFLYGILHYLISITRLSVHKTQFYFNHASHASYCTESKVSQFVFTWSVFSRVRIKCGDLQSKYFYLVGMW